MLASIGRHRVPVSDISSKYHVEIKNLMFSCLRSLIAYEKPELVKEYFMQRKLYKYFKIKHLNDLVDVRMDPILFNGPQIRKNRKDVQGYMLHLNKTLYITFRGSNDIQDLLACLDIRRQHLGDDIYIHKGYYDQFKAVESDITSDILKICNSFEVEKLVFSGHSLGGALAMIAAPYYSSLFRGNKHIVCHTFGSTTVGNDKFIEWFCKQVNEHLRIEYEDDIIPIIPIADTYKHAPNCIKLTDDHFSNNDHIIGNYIDFIKLILNHDMCNNFIEKHSCKRYLDILHKAYKFSTISVMDSNDYWESESIERFTLSLE
jgi:hypothetical protein